MIISKSITPNDSQKRAIEHPLAPLMIIAGAGTGKTFTLENRIIYMVTKLNVNPENILTITYTEKAAKEIKDRIVSKAGPNMESMFVGTFHSFCYQIINEYKYNNRQSLIDQSESIHMLLERYDELKPFESDEFALNPKKSVPESFIPFFNRIRDELLSPNDLDISSLGNFYDDSPELLNQLKDLIRIFPIFQQWKKDNNLVDYNDMILSTYNYLNSDNNFLNQIQKQYKHLIIDEFQDNNFALNEVTRLIAGKKQSITVVGDDDQVIYSFRGANSYNINTFKNYYGSHAQYVSIALETNYRSNQAILDLANESIRNNSERIQKKLISYDNSSNEKPKIFWGPKEKQLTFLISKIKSLKSKYSFSEMAILCRTHAQARTISEFLDQNGISNQSPKR